MTIIDHVQIFPNASHLPTFNSRAIESHLHRIPGLSENFLYFNDDWLFIDHVCPDDYWSSDSGYKVHVDKHSTSFLSEWLESSFSAVFYPRCSNWCKKRGQNGVCDEDCNSQTCIFDSNECVPPTSNRASFYDSVDYVKALFNDKLGYSYRWLPEHMPLMINKRVVLDLQNTFRKELELTSSHRTRQRNDIQFEFAYNSWLLEAPKSRLHYKIHPSLYRATLVDSNDFKYFAYGAGSLEASIKQIRNFLENRKGYKYLCVNDLITYAHSHAAEKQEEIKKMYQKLLPQKSKYEL